MSDNMWEELNKITEKRDGILDQIVKRANTREGQHMLEITTEIRQLCDQLDNLKK